MRVAGPVAAVLAALTLAACTDGGGTPSPSPTRSATSSPTATAPGTGGTRPAGAPRVVATIASHLQVPWGLAFLPGGDAIVTERDTRRILRIQGPQHRVRVVDTFPGAVGPGDAGEAGLLGVAVSPEFTTDRLLYFYVTTPTDNRIVRATYTNGRLGAPQVVLDGIPEGVIHDGGRLVFGPDGMLYASTGETGDSSLAQDPSSLAGKILRVTPEGRPAPGNPFPDSPVWSYGHRNVEGLAFDDSRRLWASEFGQDTFDELNLVERGHNYGWPTVEGRGGGDGLTDPQLVWDPSVASPSGLAFLDGHLWMAALRGQRLWRIDVTDGRASHPADFLVAGYGRLRTVAVAPDGRLWVTTSNRDGRGAPVPADDRILLIDPGTSG